MRGMPGSLALELDHRLSDPLRHRRRGFVHRFRPDERELSYRGQKKPAWQNTLRYSTTPAYSLSGPPADPVCPISSFPTTSTRFVTAQEMFSRSVYLLILEIALEKARAISRVRRIMSHLAEATGAADTSARAGKRTTNSLPQPNPAPSAVAAPVQFGQLTHQRKPMPNPLCE